WPRLVFVDGRYSPKLSTACQLPGGVQVASLAEAMITDGDMIERHLGRHVCWDKNVFAALNTAFVDDGGFVCLPPEVRSETPIELVFLATTPGVVAQPRTLIVAGHHSRLTVVERYVGITDEAYFTNAVTEIVADDVKCTHGAAEGQLAPEALFYLKSRGLGEETARALLTYGFAHEVLERVAVEPLQAYLDRLLMARLGSDPIAKEIV